MRKASQQAVCPVPCYGYSFGGGNNCQPVIEMHIHFRSNTPTVLACQWPGFDSLADGLTFFFFFLFGISPFIWFPVNLLVALWRLVCL